MFNCRTSILDSFQVLVSWTFSLTCRLYQMENPLVKLAASVTGECLILISWILLTMYQPTSMCHQTRQHHQNHPQSTRVLARRRERKAGRRCLESRWLCVWYYVEIHVHCILNYVAANVLSAVLKNTAYLPDC